MEMTNEDNFHLHTEEGLCLFPIDIVSNDNNEIIEFINEIEFN